MGPMRRKNQVWRRPNAEASIFGKENLRQAYASLTSGQFVNPVDGSSFSLMGILSPESQRVEECAYYARV
jgi:hypothetical protein